MAARRSGSVCWRSGIPTSARCRADPMRHRLDASFWWWMAGLVAVCLLPWNMLQDGLGADNALALFATDADSASALGQAVFHRRWWFWPVLAAQAIALASFVPWLGTRTRGRLFLAGGWGLVRGVG